MAEKLTGRCFDIRQILENSTPMVEEIVGYTMNQSRTYMDKSLELIGISELLLKKYITNGMEIIEADKIKNFAKRKIKSILEKKESAGKNYIRSISAITNMGYRFVDIPKDFKIICVYDEYMAASRIFIKTALKTANKLGYNTIISRAIDTLSSPLHLIIPELKTVFVSVSSIFNCKFEENQKINLERFYGRSSVLFQEQNISFFKEYIKKMYNEASLCAKICVDIKNQGRKILLPFISEQAASEIAAEIVTCILNS